MFKWDAENRLVEVRLGPTILASYKYDGLGRRREATSSGLTRRFIWCGNELCGRTSVGSPSVRARYYAEGEDLRETQVKQVFTTDHLGSVSSVQHAQGGALLGSFRYTPYGQVSASTGGAAPDFMYAGLYLDRNVGLYLSPTRVYDPSLGRWLNRDPIGEFSSVLAESNEIFPVGGLSGGLHGSEIMRWVTANPTSIHSGDSNIYAYVWNDPLNETDPSGLHPAMCLTPPGMPVCAAGASAVGKAATALVTLAGAACLEWINQSSSANQGQNKQAGDARKKAERETGKKFSVHQGSRWVGMELAG